MQVSTALALAMVMTATDASAPERHQSPVVEIPILPSLVRSDGGILVAFEVHLTNTTERSIGLRSVRVLGTDGRQIGEIISGQMLQLRLKRFGQRADESSEAINPGEAVLLYMEVLLPAASRPGGLDVELNLRSAEHHDYVVRTGPKLFDRTPVPVLAPPLLNGFWVAVHHPVWARGHRRMIYTLDGHARIPGRYAVDWVGVNDAGRTSRGNPDHPTDAIGYGAEVLAGADAEVAGIRNDMMEAGSIEHNPSHRLGDGSGNYVVLRLSNKRFAFYEHLQPGSITVQPGDQVRAGQVIGRLGFSGDTTGPHLHLHVADCASPLACEGVPFAISGMVEVGRYDTLDDLGSRPWRNAHPHGRPTPEWPGYNVVVRFGR